MGAWFIFNMLGFYPLSPASGNYIIGSPLFANVTLDVGAEKLLVVSAENQGDPLLPPPETTPPEASPGSSILGRTAVCAQV